jgi:hypothetical protein
VNAYLQDSLLPALANAIKLLRVVGTMLDVADGLIYISTTGLPLTGALTAQPMPNNVAACISIRTAQRGRSFRGRNFVAGLTRDTVTNSEFTPAVAPLLEGIYNGLRVCASEAGWHQSVVSRYHGFTLVAGKKVPTPRTVGIATPATNAIMVDSVVDSQRRRLPGRGR